MPNHYLHQQMIMHSCWLGGFELHHRGHIDISGMMVSLQHYSAVLFNHTMRMTQQTCGMPVTSQQVNACIASTACVLQTYALLNCDDHANYLMKHKRDPALYRPDITHQVCKLNPLWLL